MKKIYIGLTVFAFLFFPHIAVAEEYVVTGNGEGSQNQVNITSSTNDTTTQTNDAQINNNIDAEAETGDNTANNNSGDTSITTGDASADINVQNSANQSSTTNECCPQGDGSATISGNGSDTDNTINHTNTSSTSYDVNQNADITNNVYGNLNTGYNEANGNTGNVTISTGDIWANEKIKNIAINIAQIVGGLSAEEFLLKISGNGTGSDNTINFQSENEVDILLNFYARITNNSDWDLNTGKNIANSNVGNVDIRTGDIIFESEIINDANHGDVDISCCEDEPEGPGGGVNPPPQGGVPPTTTTVAQAGGETKGVDAKKDILGAQDMLPTTGGLEMLLLTLASILMFFYGWYLRMASGNAPPKV